MNIVEFFEKYPITKHIIFKGIEASSIVFIATFLFVIHFYLKYDIMKYHPLLKKYYIPIALITHMVLVFICVVILIWIFQYVFDITI